MRKGQAQKLEPGKNWEDLQIWCTERLKTYLDFDNYQDIVDGILSQHEDHVEDFIVSFLGDSTKIVHFAQETKSFLRKHRQLAEEQEKKRIPLNDVGEEVTVYQKSAIDDSFQGKKNNFQQQQQQQQQQQRGPTQNSIKPPQVQPSQIKSQAKGKKKFVKAGDTGAHLIVPGRHFCGCQARKHELVTNCTHCGKIVCSQEGKGPCLFCGYIVIDPRTDLRSNQPTQKQVPNDKEFNRAMAHKNKLLEFDKTAATRTVVFDDQSDYFTTDWATPEERKQAEKVKAEERKRKEEERRKISITIDVDNVKIVENKTASSQKIRQDIKQKELEKLDAQNVAQVMIKAPDNFTLINPYLKTAYPTFVQPSNQDSSSREKTETTKRSNSRRIQHDYFEE